MRYSMALSMPKAAADVVLGNRTLHVEASGKFCTLTTKNRVRIPFRVRVGLVGA
jgi:hypothetical protein